MVEALALCQPLFIPGNAMPFRREIMKVKLMKDRRSYFAKAALNLKQQPEKDHKKPLTVNLSSILDTPLYESPEPEVSFDQYMEDQQRLIKALFPDAEDQQLNKNEWRIQFPTMQLLFLSFYFAFYIKFRYRSMGNDCPPHVRPHTPKITELELARWELGGISKEYQPRDLSLNFKGIIYPDRKEGRQSRLRSQFDMNLRFILSPLLGWVPHSVMHSLVEPLVKTAMVDSTSNSRLLEDYDEFKREKLKKYGLVKH